MRIKEVAERTGFSAPTLRYYEEIGLLPAPTRTAAGYRTYDEATVERLAFIARAKWLGCSLDEIADLTTAGSWRQWQVDRAAIVGWVPPRARCSSLRGRPGRTAPDADREMSWGAAARAGCTS